MRTLAIVAALVMAGSTAVADDDGANRTPVYPEGPSGQISVVVSYAGGIKPKAATSVSLVAYAADKSVKVLTAMTKDGAATFRNLDTTGATAYFALAQIPRKAGADRFVSVPVVLDATTGGRIVMHAIRPESAEPAYDGLAKLSSTKETAARTKVHVQLQGATEENTAIEIFDAASGKVIAKGEADGDDLEIAVKARAGQVLFVEAKTKQDRYRSLPFPVVGDRGAAPAIYIYPRLLPSYRMGGLVDDASITFSGTFTVSNYSWTPWVGPDGQGPLLPLPERATKVDLDDDSKQRVAITKDGKLQVLRPVPPGELEIGVEFELAANNKREVEWTQTSPLGIFKGVVMFAREPGLVLPNHGVGKSVARDGTEYDTFEDTATPGAILSFKITLPKPSPANALLHACRPLTPDAKSPLLGKSFDFTLPTIDGTKRSLTKARKGGPALVLMTAPWVHFATKEPAAVAALAKQVPGVTTAVVFSSTDAKEILAESGKLEKTLMFADAPKLPGNDPMNKEATIGAVTYGLGVTLLPETVFVDRKGVVRAHFVNAREWNEPEAVRCIKALAAQK